jgi:hypothetical protein
MAYVGVIGCGWHAHVDAQHARIKIPRPHNEHVGR